jgi:hypothetical protein
MLDQGPLVGCCELTQAAAIKGRWHGAQLFLGSESQVPENQVPESEVTES